MSYIGRQLNNLSDRVKLDSITASATATYNLLLNGVAYVPSSAESLTVSLNGVIQAPQDSYTVSSSTITFASSLTSSDSIDFILAERSITLQTPSSGSVNTEQLANSSVTNTKVASSVITSQTEKTSLADADKFLISDSADSGALKYVQNSNLGGGGLILLGTITSSSATNSTFQNGSNGIVFDSTYSTYIITLNGMTCSSDDDNFRVSFSHDSGSNYNSNASTVFDKATINSSGSASSDGSPSGTFASGSCNLVTAQSNGSAEGFNGIMEFHGMHITNRIKGFTFRFQAHQHNNLRVQIHGAGTVERNEDIDGIRFNCNSGTHSGTLRLYGMKAS